MKPVLRVAVPVALALTVSACSIGSLLGGGGKAPTSLLRLTPQAALQGDAARSASAGEAVTIVLPIIAKELRTTRVPAITYTQVAYIEDLQWVDTPDRLFQDLLAETVRRTTGRVVLDPKQSGLDPGITVSGQLHRFGYDAAEQAVVVRFDGAMATAGGTRVETRRFEARVPAAADAASVGPALNQAANQVALEAASWIGR
jgi:cholesterol transport system auxiliary component